MGRAPCCDKANVKRGPWSPEEDAKLKDYIEKHGTGGNWIALPHKAGLKRCGKSCRLRWLNYLRPNIKHGEFSSEEDRVICSLYASIGSRWSIIAAQLPGRTDNDIKNYWNTKLKKKLMGSSHSKMILSSTIPENNIKKYNYLHNNNINQNPMISSISPLLSLPPYQCTNITYNNNNLPSSNTMSFSNNNSNSTLLQSSLTMQVNDNSTLLMFGGDQQASTPTTTTTTTTCSSSDGSHGINFYDLYNNGINQVRHEEEQKPILTNISHSNNSNNENNNNGGLLLEYGLEEIKQLISSNNYYEESKALSTTEEDSKMMMMYYY
ncbi:uncharacterized protein LOC141653102 [Silene latifolia]|uniref:uncharacterized protein LOC141653102 n=1 Tax=Silene latifolia TaxID=37657 RepID=UPI003D786946